MAEPTGTRPASTAEIQASIVINRQVNRISTEIIRKSTEVGEDREHVTNTDFVPSRGLTSDEASDLLKKWGRNELLEKSTPTWLVIFRLVLLISLINFALLASDFIYSALRAYAHHAMDCNYYRSSHRKLCRHGHPPRHSIHQCQHLLL